MESAGYVEHRLCRAQAMEGAGRSWLHYVMSVSRGKGRYKYLP